MKKPKIAFEPEVRLFKLCDLIPVRDLKEVERASVRYSKILSSIPETGITEPLVVFPLKGSPGKYLVLDGNLRFHALNVLKMEQVRCVVATEEECYTYNARVNRLSPIQEHHMITKAVRDGVPIERIAAALNLSVSYIEDSLNLLKGLDPQTVSLLSDRTIAHAAIAVLKKVKPARQIEMAEMMIKMNMFSAPYAKALLACTKPDLLLIKRKPKKSEKLSEEDAIQFREEMQNLEQSFKEIEESYGENFIKLTAARGYIQSLLKNNRISRWLSARHADFFEQFRAIVASEAI